MNEGQTQEKFFLKKWKECALCKSKLTNKYYGLKEKTKILPICEDCSKTHIWSYYCVEEEETYPINVTPSENLDTVIERKLLLKVDKEKISEMYGVSLSRIDKVEKKLINKILKSQ